MDSDYLCITEHKCKLKYDRSYSFEYRDLLYLLPAQRRIPRDNFEEKSAEGD